MWWHTLWGARVHCKAIHLLTIHQRLTCILKWLLVLSKPNIKITKPAHWYHFTASNSSHYTINVHIPTTADHGLRTNCHGSAASVSTWSKLSTSTIFATGGVQAIRLQNSLTCWRCNRNDSIMELGIWSTEREVWSYIRRNNNVRAKHLHPVLMTFIKTANL